MMNRGDTFKDDFDDNQQDNMINIIKHFDNLYSIYQKNKKKPISSQDNDNSSSESSKIFGPLIR